MRRWFTAIAASLFFHLLLLLIPPSLPEASEPLPPLRLVLRHLETPVMKTPVDSEMIAPGAVEHSVPQAPETREEPVVPEIREVPLAPLQAEGNSPAVRTAVEKQVPRPEALSLAALREMPKERPTLQKTAKKKVSRQKEEPSPEKAPPAAPPLSAQTPTISLLQEIPTARGGPQNRKISSPLSYKKATEPIDGETLSIVKRAVPIYPLFSRKRGEEGKAVILVTIQSGRVTDAEVERSSGFSRIDAAALRASRLWIFSEKITARARIPFLFQLEK